MFFAAIRSALFTGHQSIFKNFFLLFHIFSKIFFSNLVLQWLVPWQVSIYLFTFFWIQIPIKPLWTLSYWKNFTQEIKFSVLFLSSGRLCFFEILNRIRHFWEQMCINPYFSMYNFPVYTWKFWIKELLKPTFGICSSRHAKQFLLTCVRSENIWIYVGFLQNCVLCSTVARMLSSATFCFRRWKNTISMNSDFIIPWLDCLSLVVFISRLLTILFFFLVQFTKQSLICLISIW